MSRKSVRDYAEYQRRKSENMATEPKATTKQLNALLEHKNHEIGELHRQLEDARKSISSKRYENDLLRVDVDLAKASVQREMRTVTLLKERHQVLLEHVNVAVRACRRGRTKKKKAASLRQAREALEAALEEDGEYRTKLWKLVTPWSEYLFPAVILGGAAVMAYLYMGVKGVAK